MIDTNTNTVDDKFREYALPPVVLYVCPDCGALYWKTHLCKTALHDGWFEPSTFGPTAPTQVVTDD